MPISTYNKTKMISERVLMSFKDKIVVNCIRPATVCGLSPRMRFDISVNLLTLAAIKKNKIKICIVGLTYKYGVSDIRNSQKIEIFKHFKKKFKQTKCFDPFFKSADNLKFNELKKYNFFIFLSKGKKFSNIANLVDKKKIIDPFFYYSN